MAEILVNLPIVLISVHAQADQGNLATEYTEHTKDGVDPLPRITRISTNHTPKFIQPPKRKGGWPQS